MKTKKESWIFVIDTENYAGNFEREMCAYITGVVGECGVGQEMADLYLKETGEEESRFIDVIDQVADEQGCDRPCQIWETPGWYNNGYGLEYKKDDTEEALKHFIESRKEHLNSDYTSYIEVKKSLNEGRKVYDWTLDACEEMIEKIKKEIEELKDIKELPNKYPAYLSVAIFFSEKPTSDQIKFMKKRLENFVNTKRENGREWDKDFDVKITGFRLLKKTVSIEETNEEIKI